MTPDTYPISTALARLFLALVETLDDPELLTDLQPTWEVQPGISTFSLTAQRRARARLAALDPADLHRRILEQGIPSHDLPELLTTFRLDGVFRGVHGAGWVPGVDDLLPWTRCRGGAPSLPTSVLRRSARF